ncbi:MAG TPA: SDR family NAD(P)-dependent oxidoreductase, partial [Chloroflexota bacterium]|nr:SDR family NAD(P)-dependent oxidoreductase [Chloroflexota bacterium]
MLDLSGKVAVVTGASGALGSAAARQLQELGATVVWNYNRTRPEAEHAFQADVSTSQGAQALVDYAVKE